MDWTLFVWGGVWFATQISVIVWVWRDCRRLAREGVDVALGVWVALSVFAWPVALLGYLIFRSAARRQLSTSPQGPPVPIDSVRAAFWVVGILVAAVAAMFAANSTIPRLPWPDQESIDFGVFLFFLITILDVLYLVERLGSRWLRKATINWRRTFLVFGLVLLLAPAAAALFYGQQLWKERSPGTLRVAGVTFWVAYFSWLARRAWKRSNP